MTTIDWTEMCVTYKGSCVALLEKRPTDRVTVVAIGRTFEEAEENAKQNGYPHAEVYCVPMEDTLFVGGRI